MADNPIFAINTRVAQLRADGADIVMLTAGEPQAATAPAIVAAAQHALADEHHHHYGPAAGDPVLRGAIAAALPGQASWTAEDVLITAGAKHALFLALHAILTSGEDVLIITPGWPGHAAAVIAAGAVPVSVPTTSDLQITAAQLQRYATARTRAVILASPANPTGAVISAAELAAIADWATARGIWVISDDVYSAFDYTGTYTHVLDTVPQVRDRLIIIDSVSKKHAMTGWRIGWLAAPAHVIRPAREHLSATVTGIPLALQCAARTAIADANGPVQAKARYAARRQRIVTALNDIPGVECPLPDGGMFVFPSLRGLLEHTSWDTSAPIVEHLLDHGVAVVPGEAFEAPQRLRICYAVDDDTLDTAIHRLQKGLRSVNGGTA